MQSGLHTCFFIKLFGAAYVQNFVDGKISRETFWELAKFKKPTHQISFHTAKALAALNFLKGYGVIDDE